MATLTITAGGVTLPDNVVGLAASDELLWSEGTGRSATDGQMAGSVVAQKRTWQLEWGPLTQAQRDAVRSIPTGFFQLTIALDGATVASATCYRGNVTGDLMGRFGGDTWWSGVSVQLIER